MKRGDPLWRDYLDEHPVIDLNRRLQKHLSAIEARLKAPDSSSLARGVQEDHYVRN